MREEIIELFGGDTELIDSWRLFFVHNGWLKRFGDGYRASGKGAARISELRFT